jgi:hypothetical protein
LGRCEEYRRGPILPTLRSCGEARSMISATGIADCKFLTQGVLLHCPNIESSQADRLCWTDPFNLSA